MYRACPFLWLPVMVWKDLNDEYGPPLPVVVILAAVIGIAVFALYAMILLIPISLIVY